MREMGIASSILEAASLEARQYPGYRTAKVGMAIGKHAGADADPLQSCFEALIKGAGTDYIDISWYPGGNESKLAYVELETVVNYQRCYPILIAAEVLSTSIKRLWVLLSRL